ncbi:hypothetical protein C8R43DRAFT_942377 [Mycena crocata]|nr:hypothetical protein C8R43DRAFT_942377 [Mycena crocata]
MATARTGNPGQCTPVKKEKDGKEVMDGRPVKVWDLTAASEDSMEGMRWRRVARRTATLKTGRLRDYNKLRKERGTRSHIAIEQTKRTNKSSNRHTRLAIKLCVNEGKVPFLDNKYRALPRYKLTVLSFMDPSSKDELDRAAADSIEAPTDDVQQLPRLLTGNTVIRKQVPSDATPADHDAAEAVAARTWAVTTPMTTVRSFQMRFPKTTSSTSWTRELNWVAHWRCHWGCRGEDRRRRAREDVCGIEAGARDAWTS